MNSAGSGRRIVQNDRREVLKAKVVVMTRAEYETYLLGEHWHDFSYRIKKERGRCEVCGIDNAEAYKRYRQGLNVHHKTYKNIGNEKPEDVVALCYQCHMGKHGQEDWVKFCSRFAMLEVQSFNVPCGNCGIAIGPKVWNMDELSTEWYCEDCR